MANPTKNPPQPERELSRKEGDALTRITTDPQPASIPAPAPIVRPAGFILMEGETLEGAYDVDQMRDHADAAREAEAARRAKLEGETYRYFVKCRRPHPRGAYSHGIYLTRNPKQGEVKPHEWDARYRGRDAAGNPLPWYETVICMVCLKEYGERVPLEVRMTGNGCFTVAPRWLWRKPLDPARAAIEGETRAEEGPYAGANVGRTEAVEKAVKAGYEAV